ncbi:MAG: hypothetical protein ABW171_13265, partial [Steroidobacter sp.]
MQTTQEGPSSTYRVASQEPAASSRSDSAPLPVAHLRSVEGRMLRALLHAFGDPPIQFALWNGDRVMSAIGE